MFGTILGFLRSGKVLGGIAVVIGLLGAGWYVLSLSQENGKLEEQLAQTKANNQQLSVQMERTRQKFTTEIDALNSSITTYMSSLSVASETNKMLQKDLNEGAKDDKELQKCLDKSLPDSAYQRLLNGQPATTTDNKGS